MKQYPTMLCPRRFSLRCAALAATFPLSVSAPNAANDDISAVYTGNSISIIISAAPGSLQDRYARTIGRYLIRHIPGSPSIQFENMQGSSGRKATAWLHERAPRDGLTFAALMPEVIMAPLVGDGAEDKYDPLKFNYLGSAASAVFVCVARPDAPVTHFGQVKDQRLVIGAVYDGGATQDIAHALVNLTGARFRMVSRYEDEDQLLAALEHGEVHGACGYNWSGLRTRRPELIKEKKVRILLQIALRPRPDLSVRGGPIVWDFVDDAGHRAALELLAGIQEIGRPYAAPPKVVRRRVTALRVAFERTMKDIDFRADARKSDLDISPTYGDDMQRMIEKMYRTPKDIVDKARAARKASDLTETGGPQTVTGSATGTAKRDDAVSPNG